MNSLGVALSSPALLPWSSRSSAPDSAAGLGPSAKHQPGYWNPQPAPALGFPTAGGSRGRGAPSSAGPGSGMETVPSRGHLIGATPFRGHSAGKCPRDWAAGSEVCFGREKGKKIRADSSTNLVFQFGLSNISFLFFLCCC